MGLISQVGKADTNRHQTDHVRVRFAPRRCGDARSKPTWI